MMTFRTIVSANMRIASVLQLVDLRGPHFFPTPTFGKFGEAGCRQALNLAHVGCNAQFAVWFSRTVRSPVVQFRLSKRSQTRLPKPAFLLSLR